MCTAKPVQKVRVTHVLRIAETQTATHLFPVGTIGDLVSEGQHYSMIRAKVNGEVRLQVLAHDEYELLL